MTGSVTLREARLDDIGAMQALDAPCRLSTWSELGYRGLLQRPDVESVVAEDGSEGVIGYYIASNLPDDAEILKIAVEPGYQGQGIGQQLLTRALQRAAHLGCSRCFLEVRPSNYRAIRFYLRNGFRAQGRRRDYYHDPREDALIMYLDLGKAPGDGDGR